MPLDKDRLGNAMADAIINLNSLNLEAADETAMRDQFKVLADEIIKEFIANAVVSTTTTSTGSTGAGPPGGPLPITGLPGTGAGGITA